MGGEMSRMPALANQRDQLDHAGDSEAALAVSGTIERIRIWREKHRLPFWKPVRRKAGPCPVCESILTSVVAGRCVCICGAKGGE
jgi:hypothetical protein